MSRSSSAGSRFEALFAEHRSATIPQLWPWQKDVLASYENVEGDIAVELPTGSGKTLVGLLVGEDFRQSTTRSVAYLAGNKQLAQQVERQARHLNFPVVRFQGSKESWPQRDVRDYNFGRAIGVMNYWNYFNASPGIDPAGLLVLDDVHLLEGPLRDFFTVEIRRSDSLYEEILSRIIARCPYYTLAADLLNGLDPVRPPEMLAFLDSAELADEIRDLLDDRLQEGSTAWWAWQQIRDRLEACCWLVSKRAVTLTPYIPPSQTIPHFYQPTRRLYLSATVGSVDDLQRRLGALPTTKLTASVQPRQGERLVVIRGEVGFTMGTDLVEALRPVFERYPKALWLCARRETAMALEMALELSGLQGTIRRLEGDNGADEPFAAEAEGHLVAAGRYDGMDFPDEACRIEVLPEVPIATSDLEEFVSAYLRDAEFAEARFAQRVSQALGRCNRSETDRAVYVLTDPEFLSRLSQRRTVDGLPDEVRADILAALERSDRGFAQALEEAQRFLDGESFPPAQPMPRGNLSVSLPTATDEVNGFLALWREDYRRSSNLFDRVASRLSNTREHRAFWLAMRSLALHQAAEYGDSAARYESRAVLRAAANAGATSVFFTRLRLAEGRLTGIVTTVPGATNDDVFSAWDRLIARYGTSGPRFDRWNASLMSELQSTDHNTVARAIARIGSELLGVGAEAPEPTSGEHDAHWELSAPYRLLTFEVKLAPTAQRVINSDVEQAEGAVRAFESRRSRPVRGLIVTPHADADRSAIERLGRVRLIQRGFLMEDVQSIVALLREYRRGWNDDAGVRSERRAAVEGQLPAIDWLWMAADRAESWVSRANLDEAWQGVRLGSG